MQVVITVGGLRVQSKVGKDNKPEARPVLQLCAAVDLRCATPHEAKLLCERIQELLCDPALLDKSPPPTPPLPPSHTHTHTSPSRSFLFVTRFDPMVVAFAAAAAASALTVTYTNIDRLTPLDLQVR
jgi:hypothetical protein